MPPFLNIISVVELSSRAKISVRAMNCSGTFAKVFNSLCETTNVTINDLRMTRKQITEFCSEHREHMSKTNGTMFLFTERDEPATEDCSNLFVCLDYLEKRSIERKLYPFLDPTEWNGVWHHHIVTPKKGYRRRASS